MFNDHNNHANTSQIENYLYSVLYGTVSNHIMLGTVSEPHGDWDDMILIDCDLPIDDYGPYSKATVYIFLYARPRPDGSKNVAKLARMEEDLNTVLDTVVHPHYTFVRQSNGADYDANVNWHRNYVYLTLNITS